MNEFEYYNNLSKDTSLTPEQRSLAEAMKTKARINTAITGLGIPAGAGVGWAAGHPFVGGTVAPALAKVNNFLWNKGLQDAIQKNNLPVYNPDLYTKNTPQAQARPQAQAVQQPVRGNAVNAATVQPGTQLSEILSASSQQPTTDVQYTEPNISAINNYVSQLKDIQQPYIDSLTNYYKNYDEMLKRNQAYKRYWQGISSITGNPNWARIADAYNPIVNEANKVGLVKQLQDAQAGDVNAINEIMGNMAIAQELGLEPEAAFANKNLLTALSMKDRENTKLEIALANNLVKKYGIDKNYARALAVQALRNQGSLAVANTYMGGYQPAPGLTPGGTANGYTNPVTQPSNTAGLFQRIVGH